MLKLLFGIWLEISLFSQGNKEKVKYLGVGCKHKHMKKASSSSSSGVSPKEHNPKCRDSLIEFGCSACFFCIFCPLSVVWCCAKLPCKIGWRTARYAINWACCCTSDKRVSAEYSSFSDLDFDDIDMPCKSPAPNRPTTRVRIRHRTRCS